MANVLQIVINATDNASAVMKGVTQSSEDIAASLRKTGLALTAIGAAITASMGLAVKGYVSAGEQIGKMAKQTGFATTTLSKLKYVADSSNVSFETINSAAKGMAQTLQSAVDPASEQARALELLHLNIGELLALKPEDRFLALANAVAKVPDPTMRAAVAQQIFGRAGIEMLPMLEDLPGLLQGAAAHAPIFTEDDVQKAEAFSQSLTDLKGELQKLQFAVAEIAIGPLGELVDGLVKAVEWVGKWAEKNPEAAQAIVLVVGAVGALATVLGPVLLGLGSLATIATALGIPFLTLAGVLGIVVLAVGWLAAAFVAVEPYFDSIGADISRLWANIKENAVLAFESIADVIMTPVKAVLAFIDALRQLWTMVQQFLGLNRRGAPTGTGGEDGKGGDTWESAGGRRAGGIIPFNALPGNEGFTGGPGGAVPANAGVSSRLSERAGGRMSGELVALAEGGIVTAPTYALVGERGDEAVIPLEDEKLPIENVINMTVELDGETLTTRTMRRSGETYLRRSHMGG